jgi:hypothetical protein
LSAETSDILNPFSAVLFINDPLKERFGFAAAALCTFVAQTVAAPAKEVVIMGRKMETRDALVALRA